MFDCWTNVAWQRLDDQAMSIYSATRAFPAEERYGLTAQMRQAAVSAPANVAEGSGREGIRDCLRFLYMARGSLAEVEYCVHLATRLGYLQGRDREQVVQLREEAGRTLHGPIACWENQAQG